MNYKKIKPIKIKLSGGFSLIELMIVVGIVGILASIAIPSYQDSIRKARRTDVMDALTDCASAQARNYSTASPPSYFSQADINDAGGNAFGACNNLVSKDGYYELTVQNTACAVAPPGGGDNSFWCFVLTATPVAGRSQASDNICVSWTLNYQGRKTAEDAGGNDSTANCWRS